MGGDSGEREGEQRWEGETTMLVSCEQVSYQL